MGRRRNPDTPSSAERTRAWRQANPDHKVAVRPAAKDKAAERAEARGQTIKDYVSDLIEAAP